MGRQTRAQKLSSSESDVGLGPEETDCVQCGRTVRLEDTESFNADQTIYCNGCPGWMHRMCAQLSEDDFEKRAKEKENASFFCPKCVKKKSQKSGTSGKGAQAPKELIVSFKLTPSNSLVKHVERGSDVDSQVKEGNDKDEDYSSDKAESEDETASESNEDDTSFEQLLDQTITPVKRRSSRKQRTDKQGLENVFMTPENSPPDMASNVPGSESDDQEETPVPSGRKRSIDETTTPKRRSQPKRRCSRQKNGQESDVELTRDGYERDEFVTDSFETTTTMGSYDTDTEDDSDGREGDSDDETPVPSGRKRSIDETTTPKRRVQLKRRCSSQKDGQESEVELTRDGYELDEFVTDSLETTTTMGSYDTDTEDDSDGREGDSVDETPVPSGRKRLIDETTTPERMVRSKRRCSSQKNGQESDVELTRDGYERDEFVTDSFETTTTMGSYDTDTEDDSDGRDGDSEDGNDSGEKTPVPSGRKRSSIDETTTPKRRVQLKRRCSSKKMGSYVDTDSEEDNDGRDGDSEDGNDSGESGQESDVELTRDGYERDEFVTDSLETTTTMGSYDTDRNDDSDDCCSSNDPDYRESRKSNDDVSEDEPDVVDSSGERLSKRRKRSAPSEDQPPRKKYQREQKLDIRESALSVGIDSPDVITASKYWELDIFTELNGDGLIIAVLDTGINRSHPVFQSKEKLFDGRNFVTGENFLKFDDTDQHSHGTAVAAVATGICVPQFGEKAKLIGVAPNASLAIFRVAQSHDLPYDVSAVIKALESIHSHNVSAPNKIRVVVMSFRLPEISESDLVTIKKLINSLKEQAVICVVAAGNDGRNKSPTCPATLSNTLSVGSVDRFGNLSKFSTRDSSIDVLAPGENVVVAVNSDLGVSDGSGTSFAAPAVAGLIALLVQVANTYSKNGTTLHHITDLDVLKKLFKKHMIVETEQGRLLQPEKVTNFFKNHVQNIDKIVNDCLC